FEYPGIWPWMRKVAADFGWDWGPAFMPVGVYKPAYLVTLSPSIGDSVPQTGTPPISPPAFSTDDVAGPIFVDEASIDIYKEGQSFSVPPDQKADWIVNVTLGIRSAAAVSHSFMTLAFPELGITSHPIEISAIPISTKGSFWVTATWSIPDHIPRRWYPHNLGTPQLYDLHVVLAAPTDEHSSETALVNFVTRTGFRTIELAQTRYSQQDIDERGIWPGDQWHFKVNGKAFYASGTNIIPFDPFYARTPADRVRWILESAVKSDFLHDIVTSETHSVPYTDCSTTKGILSLDPYILRFENGTQGEIYGNTAFLKERFNYDASAAFDYTTYPVGRFVNEFGFHSMPSFYTWEEALLSPEDFYFNSTVVMSREHHPPAGSLAFPNPNAAEGQREMTVAVEQWLPTPGTTDTNQTFAQWCWSTQIFQSMTIVSQVAWYRHGAGQSENNLGALIWQLNDIWQGVSWSAMEYSGRWKVLQYGLTGVYAPVTIYPFWTPSNETLQVLVISDRWEDVKASAQATWYDWRGRPLNRTFFDFTVPRLNNSLLFEAKGLNTILPIGRRAEDVWLHLNVTADVDGKRLTNEQYVSALHEPRLHQGSQPSYLSVHPDILGERTSG
ncbi:hypothetical protein C0991_005346, partial [Blastosporella zonata]